LSITELLDRTFSIYRNHWLAFVGIAAIPNALVLAVNLVMISGATVSGSIALALVSSLIMFVIYFVASMMTQGATMIAVSQVQLGQPTSISEAFGGIRARVGELIILSLNVGIRVMFGLILLLVPGVYLALRYSLAMPVSVLEQKGISASIERSGDLTRGHLGRILLIYVLLLALFYAGTMAWQLPLALVAGVSSVRGVTSPFWVQCVSVLGGFVISSCIGPLLTIALALVYYDERVRKEGFDLEHMLEQLNTAQITPPPVA